MEKGPMRIRRIATLVLFGCLFLVPAVRSAPNLPDKDSDMDVGVPLRAATPQNPMKFTLTGRDPNDPTKKVTCTVSVTNLPQFTFNCAPFQRPAPLQGETPLQYQMRVGQQYQQYLANCRAQFQAAWEAASKDKADKIAAAI